MTGAGPERDRSRALYGSNIQSSVRPSGGIAGGSGYADPGRGLTVVCAPARGLPGTFTVRGYNPGVETTLPVMILIIGIAIVIGRNRPILLTAGIFLVIGGLAITGQYGPEFMNGLRTVRDLIT